MGHLRISLLIKVTALLIDNFTDTMRSTTCTTFTTRGLVNMQDISAILQLRKLVVNNEF